MMMVAPPSSCPPGIDIPTPNGLPLCCRTRTGIASRWHSLCRCLSNPAALYFYYYSRHAIMACVEINLSQILYSIQQYRAGVVVFRCRRDRIFPLDPINSSKIAPLGAFRLCLFFEFSVLEFMIFVPLPEYFGRPNHVEMYTVLVSTTAVCSVCTLYDIAVRLAAPPQPPASHGSFRRA